MPGIPGTVGPPRDSRGISDEPEPQPTMESPNAELRRLYQQVAQVSEHAKMQFVSGARYSRDFGVIAPGTAIKQGIIGRVMRNINL